MHFTRDIGPELWLPTDIVGLATVEKQHAFSRTHTVLDRHGCLPGQLGRPAYSLTELRRAIVKLQQHQLQIFAGGFVQRAERLVQEQQFRVHD